MRFTGTLTTWHDDRGFGFIEADQGGQEVFVHIKAFGRSAGRPQLHRRLSFELEINAQGKKRAKNVTLAVATSSPSRARARAGAGGPAKQAPAARWGTVSLFAIPAFGLVYAGVALIASVPGWVAGLYVLASLVCFCVYAIDKSAAVSGRWRVAEKTLHLLALAGGWPGALVAQQVLRHKSNKASFRSVFWATVVVNVLGFVALNSPLRHLLQP